VRRAAEQSRQEEDEGDLLAILQNSRDFTVIHIFPLNQNSNEHTPKTTSVEHKKIYNYALGFNSKRVRVLNLFKNLAN
jgi:hypothetical protein